MIEPFEFQPLFYVLDDDDETPIPVTDALDPRRIALYNDPTRRLVAKDHVGDVEVSTVFLMNDLGFPVPGAVPLLWETMIFGGPLDLNFDRYSSKRDAIAGHARMLELVKTAAANAEPEDAA